MKKSFKDRFKKLAGLITEQNLGYGQGCSDPAALNYDPDANGDSMYGTFVCQYDYGCANFSQWAIQLHGLAVLNEELNGIPFPNQSSVVQGMFGDTVEPNEMEDYICNIICATSININPGQYCPACWAGIGGFDFDDPMNSYNIGLSMCTCCQDTPIEGCTDPNAENYNPEASVDDGSCEGMRYYCDLVTGCQSTNDPNADFDTLEQCQAEGCDPEGCFGQGNLPGLADLQTIGDLETKSAIIIIHIITKAIKPIIDFSL